MMQRVHLSLVSHTNVGKTTLARTLLRQDVGEVLDQAHVTEVAEAHTLIAADEAELLLWDTPGFGDSMRLLKRLRRYDSPLLWFFQQAWDRIADRPLWSSQQAALNIRHEADVVLYLVNAAEEPEDAGYVAPELELLSWIGRPVVLLLNQTGEAHATRAALDARLDAWREHVARWPAVREVLALDAFSRCWVQETFLLESLTDLLSDEKQPAMQKLAEAWNARNLETFESSLATMASYLEEAATARQPLPAKRPSKADKKDAMEALAKLLEEASSELMAKLLALHGLEGSAATEIDRQLDAFAVEGEEVLDPEKSAVWGSVLSGAVGGLAADLMAGGLSFGGGMLAGAILGALGGAGLAHGFELITGDRLPEVSWSRPFLARLIAEVMLRYLAVAHFGRGRGEFQDLDSSQRWQTAVREALTERRSQLEKVLETASRGTTPAGQHLLPLLDEMTRQVLVQRYPRAADLLEVEVGDEPPNGDEGAADEDEDVDEPGNVESSDAESEAASPEKA